MPSWLLEKGGGGGILSCPKALPSVSGTSAKSSYPKGPIADRCSARGAVTDQPVSLSDPSGLLGSFTAYHTVVSVHCCSKDI